VGFGWVGIALVAVWCFLAAVTWLHRPDKKPDEKIVNLDDVRGAGL